MYSQENGDEKKESFLYTLVLKVKNIKGAFKKDKGEKKYLIKDGIPWAGKKEEAEKEKENILSSVLTPKRRRAARVYAVGVFGVWKEFKRHIAYPAAVFLVVLSLLFVVNTMDLRLGYEVIIGGETIGLVTNKDDVYTAIKEAGEDIEKYTGEKSNIQEPAFILRVVSGKDAESAEDIKESILSNLDYMVNCYGIYIDSEPVLALTSKTAADWALSKHMEAVSGGAEEGETLDFVENVEVKEGYLHIGLLTTPEEAVKILGGENNLVETEYTVVEGDSIYKIAQDNDMSVERILALNEDTGTEIEAGEVLKLEKQSPLISVRSVKEEEYVEETPFEVQKIEDASAYEGTTVVSQPGQTGEKKVLAKVTEVNGIETSREVLSSEVLAEPVTQIEKIGTKERPPTTGSGVFINPSLGTLSSRFGSRWGRNHTGIDIAGSYNSDIKAADGGIVTYSGWMDGYGNYVVIDHENGYQTGYGHCASLLVEVGQRVAKGDVIAKMGSTGRSTGTHLHFEVKKDGVYQDPLSYVGY